MHIRYTDLEKIVCVCEGMQKRTESTESTSLRTVRAKGFFEKATLHSRSMITLLDRYQTKKVSLDIAALCILSRCIIEIHNASGYLLRTGLTKNESDLRNDLFILNHSSELKIINSGLGIHKRNFIHDHTSILIEKQLEMNPAFQALDASKRNKLLKREYPYQLKNIGAPQGPVSRSTEAAAIKLFSHGIHSFSLSLSPMDGGRDSVSGGTNMAFLASEMALIYLSHIALQYWRIRFRAIKTFSLNEKNLLIDGTSQENLKNWQSEMQNY